MEEERMAHILIVEDETSINELMKRSLSLVGHSCTQAYTGQQAVDKAAGSRPDLVLLDVSLPDLDGFHLIRFLEGLPVIYVTARDEVADRVRGLNAGAEDYIVKPFDMNELLARVNTVLRRFHREERVFMVGDMKVNVEERRVWLQGREIELTSREFALLSALVINRNLALSREQLLQAAWDEEYEGDVRTVDVHIQRLRKKLGLEERIKTIFKFGYRLEG